jgi:hypothetical protein
LGLHTQASSQQASGEGGLFQQLFHAMSSFKVCLEFDLKTNRSVG